MSLPIWGARAQMRTLVWQHCPSKSLQQDPFDKGQGRLCQGGHHHLQHEPSLWNRW